MNISKVIRKAMIDKGIVTMKELSDMSDVPYVTVCGVLGGNNTSLKTVDAILDCLGLKLCVINKVNKG